MAYIDWWNRSGPATLGERFGLNEGGRINMKPGGLVEPGVTHYAIKGKLTEAETKTYKTFSLEKSVWLKDYTYENLQTDLEAGKTRVQIANELYEKNPEYFDNLKKTRKTKITVNSSINTALNDRLKKRKKLTQLNNLNEKNFLATEKLAIKDVKDFIKKNQDAYKKVYASNKIGAVSNFKEKVLDFISSKYPELIKRSEGTRDILFGQRVFTSYHLLGRTVTQKGDYGLNVALNKEVRKALGIPEKPLKGEGLTLERLNRNYNKNVANLLKIAQDKGLFPKVDPVTGLKLNSESRYYNYIKKTQIDPIRNLFGKKFNFGQEHLGGNARAALINDAESLTRITAMDPDVNRWVKGTNWDRKISTLLKLAHESSGAQAQGYLDKANELLIESDKKFGVDQTKYKIVKDEIRAIQPKASLTDSLYKKAQRALKTFVATKRYNDPNFKLLPEELKKAINFLKKGDIDKSNQFLKTAIKQIQTTKGPARVKILQGIVYLVGSGTALKLLDEFGISSAEADTLQPSDEKAETTLGEYAAGAAGIGAGAYITKHGAWNVAKKIGSRLNKIISPLLTPAASIAAHGPHKPDVTSGLSWVTPAFWNTIAKQYGLEGTIKTLLKAPNAQAKTRIVLNMLLRAGIPMAALPAISTISAAVAAPLLISEGTQWLNKKLEEADLSGEGGMFDLPAAVDPKRSIEEKSTYEQIKRHDRHKLLSEGGLTGVNRYMQLTK